MNNKKRIIVSVTNDLSTDQRVNKVCNYLADNSIEVVLLGRKLKNSLPFNPNKFTSKRFRLLFNSGVLFYAEYNIRLFFYLLFNKYDALLSNDLDTLPANYFANIFKRKLLFYDSHEVFTEVPELTNNPFKRKIWLAFEKFIVPKLNNCYTVNQSIANYFEKNYKTKFKVIKNLPNYFEINKRNKSDLGLPEDKHIIVLQGAGININRGAEEAVLAMQHLENAVLLIMGSGDVVSKLKEMCIENNLFDKVLFKDKMPYQEMMKFTVCCTIGLSLDKPIGLNYQLSLPNKLFDYIQAQIPVLASDVVEVKAVLNKYNIGETINSWEPKDIASALKIILINAEKEVYTQGLAKAKQDLVWEKQDVTLNEIYSPLLNS
ncbi:MAG: glycosyltransferase [Bacteroidota bacterium]